MKFDSLLDLQETFKEEDTCIDFLKQMRWSKGIFCPYCNNKKNIYKYKTREVYKCSKCLKQFSLTVGTIFQDTKVPLKKWFIALYLFSSHKKGISSIQLSKDIGVTQKTAWNMLQRIRLLCKQDKTPLEGEIQADETFVGGKNKNRHPDKKVKGSQGRSFKDKTPVMGIYHLPSRTVRTFVISDTKSSTLSPLLLNNIMKGSVLMTDEWQGYTGMNNHYNHFIVNHSAKEYVNNGITTNNIENFWSHFKRTIIGTYHFVSRKHLQKYADESTFRFNTREMKEGERFKKILTNL
jgi:transposase-like protein